MGIKSKITNKLNNKNITLNYKYVINDNLLKSKDIIVFGGATGIGLAISNILSKAGANIIICSRSKHNLDDTFSFHSIDLEKENFLEELPKIIEEYDKIDAVVNCQGICPDIDFKQDFLEIDLNDYNAVFNINLKSVYFINQFFCKYFIENKITGNILNIASTEGLKGATVPYGISKSGVVSLTKGLGKKMAKHGITINGIAPGATATSMMKIKDKNLYKSYLPSNRMTTPEEIANMALFLLSDIGKNMIGEIVVIDGGENLV